MEIAEVSSVTIFHGEALAVLVLENGNVLPLKGMKDTTILVGERDCVTIDGSGNLKYLHLVASICMEILAIMGTIGILVIIWRDILGGF